MNDQVKMMNQSQMINQSHISMMGQSQMMSMNPQQQMLNQQQQQKPPQLINQVRSQQTMMNIGGGGYGMWPPLQEQMSFNQNPMNFSGGFVASKPVARNNWKGKKGMVDNKRKDFKRKGKPLISSSGGGGGVGDTGAGGSGGGYIPPTLKELQHENRLKARKYFPKKKFDKFNSRSAPYAPRNTSSFIIRAKKSGGIASLVSPCPVTPAVLPTPMFSPSREVLVDMAKEEWGVDGYGSMKGLIRLRSPGNEADVAEDEEEEEGGGSSESDVEEHLEVERRLDHDLSRFEMIYPNYGVEYNNVLENRVDDQDTHIAQVEEENLILKERLFLMERELGDLRRRLLSLERQRQAVDEINEEVLENESENESGSRGGYSQSLEENNEEVIEENAERRDQFVEAKEDDNNGDVIVKDLTAKEENNIGDVEVKDANNVESKEGNNNGNVEVKEANFLQNNDGDVEANNLEAMKLNNDGDVKLKEEANNFNMLNDAVVQDVCMVELANTQDEVIAENAKDAEAGNECSKGQ